MTDINRKLKGTTVKFYFNWEQMPIVGFNFGDKVYLGEYTIPDGYIKGSKRYIRPGFNDGRQLDSAYGGN